MRECKKTCILREENISVAEETMSPYLHPAFVHDILIIGLLLVDLDIALNSTEVFS